MTGHIRVGGAWKNVDTVHAKVGGVWKQVTEGHTKVAGVWKQFYSASIETPLGTPDYTYNGPQSTFGSTQQQAIFAIDVQPFTASTEGLLFEQGATVMGMAAYLVGDGTMRITAGDGSAWDNANSSRQIIDITSIVGQTGTFYFYAALTIDSNNMQAWWVQDGPASGNTPILLGQGYEFTANNSSIFGGNLGAVGLVGNGPPALGVTPIDYEGTINQERIWLNQVLPEAFPTPPPAPERPIPTAVFIANNSSPYVTAYEWTTSGTGVKYANPASLPTGPMYATDINSDNSVVTFAGANHGLNAYQWTPSGFGVKYASPSSLPTGNNFEAVRFYPGSTNTNGSIVAGGTERVIYSYPWNDGFGSQSVRNMGDEILAIDFNPGSGHIYTGTRGNLQINEYSLSSGVGGGKSSYIGRVEGLSYNPSLGILAKTGRDGTGIYYSQTSNGFNSFSQLPSSLEPDDATADIEFNNVEFDYAIAADQDESNDSLLAYYWLEFTHTRYSAPASIPNINTLYGVDFSPSGTEVAVVGESSPYIIAYAFTPFSGFGSKLSFPASWPGSIGYGITFTN